MVYGGKNVFMYLITGVSEGNLCAVIGKLEEPNYPVIETMTTFWLFVPENKRPLLRNGLRMHGSNSLFSKELHPKLRNLWLGI